MPQLVRAGVLLLALVVLAEASGVGAMVGPFSATSVLLALLPKAPFSLPRTLILSHVACIGIGLAMLALPLPPLAVAFCAAWVSTLVMVWLRAVHAPAVAHAVILALGTQTTSTYAFCVLGTALGFALVAKLRKTNSASDGE